MANGLVTMLVYDWDYLGIFKYTSKLDPVIPPPGKHTKHYGKSQFLMGKSTISTGPFSIAMFVYQRIVRVDDSTFLVVSILA